VGYCQRSILLSFAHPDDESVLAGGVACKYADRGDHVVLSTATRGESGKAGDPPVCRQEELAAVREGELREAARILGVSHVALLGHKDRELATAPPEQVREQLVRLIRQHRPQVVVTFDPNGTNLHPDHVAISRFTSDAIAAAMDRRWFPDAGEPHHVLRLLWTPPQRPWHLLRLPSPGAQPGVDFAVSVSSWSARKALALRAHRSQHQSIDRIFFSQPDVEHLLAVELFRQAWGPPLLERPLSDLFEGIESRHDASTGWPVRAQNGSC
jgi:N-acetylglucosamine malate deacetylase 2